MGPPRGSLSARLAGTAQVALPAARAAGGLRASASASLKAFRLGFLGFRLGFLDSDLAGFLT